MIRYCVLPMGIVVDSVRLTIDLNSGEAEQLVNELEGLLGRKSIQQAHKADLIGESKPIRLSASAFNLLEVGRGQRGIASQLSP